MTVKGLEKWIAQEAKAEKALRAAARKGKRERKELLALEEELPKVESPKVEPPKPESKPLPHYVFEAPRIPETLDTSIASSLYAVPSASIPIPVESPVISQPRPHRVKAPKSTPKPAQPSSQPRAPEKKNSWVDWLLIGVIMFGTAFLGLYAIKRPQPKRKEVKGFA